jgi:hypothetical protein
MPTKAQVWDVVLRSGKTFIAVFVATLTASGVNVTHLAVTKQLALSALAAAATAVLNTGIGVHNAVASNSPTVPDAPVAPTEPPADVLPPA